MGQISTDASTLEGFSIELTPQATAETLHYQAILRAFWPNWDIRETKTLGSIRLDLSGSASAMAHIFETPLRFDHGAQYTFEIDLSWQADLASPPLALARVPLPI